MVPAQQSGPGLGHAAGVSPHSARLGGDVRHRAKEPGHRSCPRTATLAQSREFCACGGHRSPPASPRRGGKRAVPRAPQGPACGAAQLPAAPRDLAASSSPLRANEDGRDEFPTGLGAVTGRGPPRAACGDGRLPAPLSPFPGGRPPGTLPGSPGPRERALAAPLPGKAEV